MNRKKDPKRLILGQYPGEINCPLQELQKSLLVDTKYNVLTNHRDYHGSFYIKNGKKENQDFKVVDGDVWNKLFSKYGGMEIRRKSIAVPTDDPVRSDFVVEVQLRQFKIHTLPQVKYFGSKVSGNVYCSRTDTVKELISKICNSSTFSRASNACGDELATCCRLWKLEADETV